MQTKGHILVIDDDSDIREAMRIILEGGDYSVATAADSEAALKMLEAQQPDLIILDVMMRYADEGFQFTYKLKNTSRWANIPIIMITSVAQKSGFKFSPEADGDFLPVDDFLEKPVRPNILIEKVSKLLTK